jgi:hypothetical protein
MTAVITRMTVLNTGLALEAILAQNHGAGHMRTGQSPGQTRGPGAQVQSARIARCLSLWKRLQSE